MALQDMLSFGGPVYTQRNPEDMPGLTASDEEWKLYRMKQAILRGPGATNNSGMTPQQMEANVGTPDPDPIKQALTDLLTAPNTVYNPALIGSYINDPTYSAPAEVPVPSATVAPDTSSGILNAAFPEVFRKNPPTGKADTRMGVERINARTEEHGVTATRDKDGRIYLTNINPDGSVNKGTGSPNSVLGDGKGPKNIVASADTPIALNASIAQLQGAKDIASAQGILMNINQTIAQQVTKLNEDALKFAANKIGIPMLEAELQQAIAADRADPLYAPGMGDSPVTAKIRTDIEQANRMAATVAQQYLSTNTQMAGLKSMETNAQMAYESIKRREEFAFRSSEQAKEWTRRQDERAQDKIDTEERKKQQVLEAEIGILSPEQVSRMAALDASVRNPDTGTTELRPAQEAAFALKKRNPKKLQEVLDLPLSQLPVAAMLGNEYAQTVVVAEELKRSPGQTQDQIREKLNRIKSRALRLTDAEIDAFKLSQVPSGDAKVVREQLKAQRNERLLNTPKGDQAKMLQQEKFQIALDMARVEQTALALNDAGKIFSADGPMGKAMAEAQKVTGARRLDDVFAAYKGSKTDMKALQIAESFNQILFDSVNNMPDSIFGRPDPIQIRAHIMEAQRNWLTELFRSMGEYKTDLRTTPAMDTAAALIQNLIR